jgi:pyruvate dehydrogenase E2 component (dihydrolipoamide acetyltransferase)
MSINITMPALSPTMEEGKLAKWHVKEGDTVSSGDVIAEIETDKATMEVEAVDEGKIGRIVVPEGTDNVKVNSVIAVLLEEGESAADVKVPEAAPAAPAPKAAEAQKAESAERAPSPQNVPRETGTTANGKAPGGDVAPPDERRAIPPAEAAGKADAFPLANGAAGRVFASPLARRLAKDAGIDVAAVPGSGPHGRIIKADIEAVKAGHLSLKAAPAAAATAAAGGAPVFAGGMSKQQVMALYPEGSYEIVPNDGMRRTVAARLTESKQTVPHFYLTLDCRIDTLLQAREQINSSAPLKDGKPVFRLSVNDFIIKAWAAALMRVPTANATWAVDSILYHKHADVAVAVAVPGGLFTPVIRAAEAKTLRQIFRGNEGSRRPGAHAQAQARRVPGRHDLDLQPGHVRHP